MSEQTEVNPAIVLVHGDFADASSWNGVIERLQQQAYTVVAPNCRWRLGLAEGDMLLPKPSSTSTATDR